MGSIAVVNVSRKKSRATISRSPSAPRQTSVAFTASSAAGQSDAGSAWATEPPIVPQLRTCGSPMPPDDVVDQRVVVDDDRVLVDLAVGRPGPDVEPAAVLGDPVEAGDGLDVDQQGRLRQPELDERDQAVAA